MLTDLDKEVREQQMQIILALGVNEILNQCGEECCELSIACNKVRRARKGLTPVIYEEAITMLNEKAGGVLLLLDYLERCGILDLEAAKESAKKKNTRWYGRTISGLLG